MGRLYNTPSIQHKIPHRLNTRYTLCHEFYEHTLRYKLSDWSLIIGGSYDIVGVLSGSWDFVDPSVLDPWPTLVAHAAAVKACPLVVEHGQL